MHPTPADALPDSFRQDRTRRWLAQLLGRGALGASSRRLLPHGFAALIFTSAVPPDMTTAKKRRKKLKLNAFGCVNVGGQCRGKDSVCCSGICQGKRPKKGKPDKSRCVAHDKGSCAAGQYVCGGTPIPCITSFGANGACVTTTGNAAYCTEGSGCAACNRDADCRDVWGPTTACFVCADCPEGTACGVATD